MSGGVDQALAKPEQRVDKYHHVVFRGAPNPPFPSRRRTLAPRPHEPVWAPRPALPSSLTVDEFEFLRWVFGQAGLNVRDYRSEPLARRLPACLRALRAYNVHDARRVIEYNPLRLSAAVSALVIGATAFFRDSRVFTEIKTTVLPRLLQRPGPLRIWSAGCSDGAELYSIAILLAEEKSPTGHDLLGTDCRYDAVARARTARYPDLAVSSVPAELLVRYFRDRGGSLEVVPELRERVRWELRQVFCPPTGRWDMVLCRNLAIYLEPQPAARLWRTLTDALRPGGSLVLGKAERPTAGLPLTKVAPCIYRRTAVKEEG